MEIIGFPRYAFWPIHKKSNEKQGVVKLYIRLTQARHDQKIFAYTTDINHRKEVGFVTSGSFSPTLKYAIGFARIKTPAVESEEQMRYCVEIRDKALEVHLVQPPFFRRQNS